MDAFIDTVVVVDLLRGYLPALAWAEVNRELRIGVSSVTWLEVLTGVQNKDALVRAERLMAKFELVYLDASDQLWAMRRFRDFKLSQGMDMNDCLIAAPSHRLNMPLFTRNLKHFGPLLGELAKAPYSV